MTAPISETYVTRKEMARILGVSPRQMDVFIREGMPSETWGTHKRFFLPSAAIRWAKQRRSSQ
jgi:phage terminase Nu1 subunit (DNA packaging protein)